MSLLNKCMKWHCQWKSVQKNFIANDILTKAWKKYKEYILDKYKDKPFDKEKMYIFI